MPIDMTSTPDDSPMFAPIPSWERNRKRGMFGGSRPARVTTTTTETLAADPLDPLAPDAPLVGEGAFAGQPVYATRTAPRRSSGPAMAITAGLVAIAGLAAAGWYASQPHDGGMAELTPGTSTATSTVAPSQVALNDAATPPPAATTHVSSADAPPAVTTRKSTTVTTTRTARARPPAARSVDDAGVNASATLPAAPQPYTGTAVNPTPAPAEAAPAPAPVEATPAPAPVSPVAPPAADTAPSVTPQ